MASRIRPATGTPQGPALEQLEARMLLSTTLFSDDFGQMNILTHWTSVDHADGASSKIWYTNVAEVAGRCGSAFCAGATRVHPNPVVAYDTLANSYDNNMNNWLQKDMSLAGVSHATVTFDYYMNIEGWDNDIFGFNARTPSGWSQWLFRDSGYSNGWKTAVVSLDNFVGQSNVTLSFFFVSNGSIVSESPSGVWIDNVRVTDDYTASAVGVEGPTGWAIYDGSLPTLLRGTAFGTAKLGGPAPIRTFTVTNTGTATLMLGNLGVPNYYGPTDFGFTITDGLPETLAPGQSDTFSVRMGTAAEGTCDATVSFTNNNADHGNGSSSTFSFGIKGTVADISMMVTPTSGLVTTEAGGTATFTVKLNTQPTANVTIGLSSSDTTEGTVSPTSLTFTPSDWSTPKTVTVTGVDDDVVDGSIPYTVITAPATSTDPNYNGLNGLDVSVVNKDNDVPNIFVSPLSSLPSPVLTTTETGGSTTFLVWLGSQPIDDATVYLYSGDQTEGTVSPTSLTFTSSDWRTPKTVTVTGVDDTVVDGNVVYSISGMALSSDANYNGASIPTEWVTNQDNDVVDITVSPLSGLVTTEAGGTATFTVKLNTQPTANVTIGLSSSD
ncbi:MAG: choice-of-anchor D domain-containing protein, partial [Planctomycetota bacterium]|nr:choice-of-anchor D domain-containing protein [Planctomycetota bacterium]